MYARIHSSSSMLVRCALFVFLHLSLCFHSHLAQSVIATRLWNNFSWMRFLQVLNIQAYEARQKEYAMKGQKHFYFMSLSSSEVFSSHSFVGLLVSCFILWYYYWHVWNILLANSENPVIASLKAIFFLSSLEERFPNFRLEKAPYNSDLQQKGQSLDIKH
jgi:hypothetical protein